MIKRCFCKHWEIISDEDLFSFCKYRERITEDDPERNRGWIFRCKCEYGYCPFKYCTDKEEMISW